MVRAPAVRDLDNVVDEAVAIFEGRSELIPRPFRRLRPQHLKSVVQNVYTRRRKRPAHLMEIDVQ